MVLNVTVSRNAFARQLAKYYRILDKKRCKCGEHDVEEVQRDCVDDYVTTNLKKDPKTEVIRCETCVAVVDYIKALRHNHKVATGQVLDCKVAIKKDMCEPFYNEKHSMAVACRSIAASICVADGKSLDAYSQLQTAQDYCSMTDYCYPA
jgi:hypothetical protein